jgi:monoamine oxidase
MRTEDLLSIAQSGLQPQATNPKKVIVVGAGMAGLVASYELLCAGHEVTILEAQERVGGRILTVREPFSDGLYAEAGAMRLPAAHKLTQTYVGKFGLQTIEFTRGRGNAFFYVNGLRQLKSEVNRDPACLGLNLLVPDGNQTALQWWAKFLDNTAESMKADEAYWDELRSQYEDYSFFDFFRRQGWSPQTITAFALLEGVEPILRISFPDILRYYLQFHDTHLTQIVGGMDGLPRAFLPELEGHIQFGAAMVALDYKADSVSVHYQSKTGLQQVTGDFAIVAIPYPALRFVDVVKPFSPGKQMALRQLQYHSAVKVLLQCRRRFWEEDEGLYGGSTVTDLPIQQIYYPEHGRETGRGVLIGTYTYGEEAKRWAALPSDERIAQTLKYVAQIHPQVREEFEVGFSKVWAEDKFAGDAFALFEPGQQADLYPYMVAPEGPVHFAGEHISSKKAWIEGAVESGLRAASEVHERALIAAS